MKNTDQRKIEIDKKFVAAAEDGDKIKIYSLLRQGANINACNDSGLSALHAASKNGHVEIVKKLLLDKADITIVNTKDNSQQAVHYAAYIENEILQLLLDAGAKVDADDIDGNTPLHIAAYKGAVKIVEILLNNNAKIDAQNFLGETPLYYAVIKNQGKTVEFLLNKGANQKLLQVREDSALHTAAHFGCYDSVKLLLMYQGDPNIKDSQGRTPLDFAASYKSYEVCKLLVCYGATVTELTKKFLEKDNPELISELEESSKTYNRFCKYPSKSREEIKKESKNNLGDILNRAEVKKSQPRSRL